MTDDQAETFINYVLNLRKSGVEDENDLLQELDNRFEGTEDQFRWALEMISTGAFRAGIISSGKHYPNGNLKIEDDPILKNAFRMHWVELKGQQHYEENYLRRNHKWWQFWKT